MPGCMIMSMLPWERPYEPEAKVRQPYNLKWFFFFFLILSLLTHTELNGLFRWTRCYGTFDQLSKHGADQMTICPLFKQRELPLATRPFSVNCRHCLYKTTWLTWASVACPPLEQVRQKKAALSGELQVKPTITLLHPFLSLVKRKEKCVSPFDFCRWPTLQQGENK